jgi:hypothetical protein
VFTLSDFGLAASYDLPQERVGDVYLLVGLGARALLLTNYPILTTSDVSMQR